MTEWYISIDGEARGPGSTDALRGFLKNTDPKRVHVWREGFDGWKRASEVPELCGPVRPPPPPAPPPLADEPFSRVANKGVARKRADGLVAGEPIAGPPATTVEPKVWRWATFG